MGTMPGAVVIPKNYGEAMVLYSAIERVAAVVDGAPVGKNGRLFIVEPEKPTKVPYEAGRFILEHYAYLGVVRVDELESETGVTYDVEKARTESLALTVQMDDQRFNQYVQDVVTDYLNQKKPAPKTPAVIQKIIERRGYDLKRYGIFPLGERESANMAKVEELEKGNKAKDEQIQALQRQMADLATTVANLKSEEETAPGKKKG
jgi:hypothetical protein